MEIDGLYLPRACGRLEAVPNWNVWRSGRLEDCANTAAADFEQHEN